VSQEVSPLSKTSQAGCSEVLTEPTKSLPLVHTLVHRRLLTLDQVADYFAVARSLVDDLVGSERSRCSGSDPSAEFGSKTSKPFSACDSQPHGHFTVRRPARRSSVATRAASKTGPARSPGMSLASLARRA
jgi:hypothetical protein